MGNIYFSSFFLSLIRICPLLLSFVTEPIPNSIKLNNNCYILTTKNTRAILNVVNFFNQKFKVIKSLEFKLWSKAKFYNDKGKINKVFKIYKILVKLRKKL